MTALRAPRSRDVSTASVPGRICLAGESLDWMTGGNSVTAAVPLRTRVTAWRADGSDALALISGPPLYQTRLVPAARAAASVYDGDVLDHMQAAAKVTVQTAADLAGIVVTVGTDLPVGTGVSSSAALTLAAVSALSALRTGEAPGTTAVCALARQAEAGELGTGAGWMDFLRPHAGPITASLGLPVVLIDTRQRRATAAVLAGKRERYQAREPAMLTYVAETTALVQALSTVLHSLQPDYREAGALLGAAHALLRGQVACSTPLIEQCVSRVLAAGAYGAKLSGSGHGGCLFAVVPDEAVAAVLASVVALPVHAVALPRSDRLDGLTVNFSNGRWFNLRPSNTEPLLRLNVEAPTRDAMTAIRDEVLALIR